MKKFLVMIMAMAMCFSLSACGGDKKEADKAEPAKTETGTETADGEFSAEQQELAQKYLDMCTRYDEVVEKVNNDPNIAGMEDVITIMNELSDSVIEADEVFASPETLDAETMKTMDLAIEQTHLFLDEVESMLNTFGGKEVVTIDVEIINNTGADFYTLSMSPQNDDDWGVNLLSEPVLNGESVLTEMSFTADTLVWDILAGDAEENTVTFMGLDFTEAPMEGAKLEMTLEGDTYMASFVE